MELAVYNQQGQDTGRKIQLNDEVFGIEPNEHAVYLDVKQFLANQRQGTHKSKERSEVSGSTRKLHKQKGGGGSRIGDINVVDSINFDAPKTKDFVNFTKNLKVEGKKLLLVLSDKNNNVYLSSRNVPNVHLMNSSDINTYALLYNNAIIMTEGSVELINNSK